MAHLSNLIFSAEKIMLQPLDYISQKGHERNSLFARIWRGFNIWYECPKDKKQKIAELLDDTFSISLPMDDVTDATVRRRGLPAGHLIFGLPHICYGVLYTAFDILEKFLAFDEHKEKFIESYVDMVLEILQNQTMTLYFRNKLICPTFEEYVKYLCYPIWIPATVKMLQLYGKSHLPDVPRSLAEKLSTFWGIYNDYLNLRSKKYSELKVSCDDVTEGKMTFLVIHAVRSHPEDNRILEILKNRPTDAESKNRFVSILQEFGTFDFAVKTMKKLRDEVVAEAEELYKKKNPYIEKTLDDVLDNIESDGAIYAEVCDPPKKIVL